MKKGKVEGGFFKRLKKDFGFRTYVASTVSFFFTSIFAGYNVFLGAAYQTVWNIGIASYYLLLVGVRAFVGFEVIKLSKSQLSDGEKEKKRENVYIAQSVMLFLIDVALTGPITIMVLQKKSVEYSQIPALAIAAYTVYKLVTSSVNYARTRKTEDLNVKMFKNVDFIDALVSLLTLQYTLIMTFGDGVQGDMLTLCAMTSFAVLVLLIAVSGTNLIRAIKIKRERAL